MLAIAAKANRVLGLLKDVLRLYGYLSLVRPFVEYACLPWKPRQQYSEYLSDKLERIQRNGSRWMILGKDSAYNERL